MSCKLLNCHRYYSQVKPEKVVKYTKTIFLPQTKFPQFLNQKQFTERDSRVQNEYGFSELYSWQRANMRGKEFTLLDGPPYANGQLHIGHAINKVLKDIIIRSKLVQNHRVYFMPGWDCHGLPIELKAVGQQASQKLEDPLEIRQRARQFAANTVNHQKEAFCSWGILADWKNQVYHTYDPQYVIQQLQIFWSLYDQGLLYRDLKPVYWSPSSKTALAEAELVYKDDHVSSAVIVRLELINTPAVLSAVAPLYILIWTTTPWTLPLNEAVCFSKSIEYSLVTFKELEGRYIIATCLIPELVGKLQKEVLSVEPLPCSLLENLEYKHPWRRDTARRLVEADHVTSTGTGFVHSAPAHGHDDFLVGLKHGLCKECFVDGEGRYTAQAGSDLSGLEVLSSGSKFVLEHLASEIVHSERYIHKYPYDWRTNKPVIIRASHQWFIDTAQLKKLSLDCLDKISGPTDRLRSLLSSRAYWCVSRQRSWGVPIPAFYHKTSGRPLISKAVVDTLCSHISRGNLDAWWTLPKESLLSPTACNDLFINVNDAEKGYDIMDIWFDSGVAWNVVDDRVADVCIEGGDQHTGWFQSLLLTSVAIRGCAPTKCLLTHGFAVDDEGRKMSKSLGNVVDPQGAKNTFGVDALRWWVAGHAHHALIPASERHLQDSRDSVNRLRGTIRFLLGALKDCPSDLTSQHPSTVLDRYILDCCHTFYHSVMSSYDSYSWNQVVTKITNFATGPVSSLYLHVIKDRLYCDETHSRRRRSCLVALEAILETLITALAPILPHLAEEVYSYHPLCKDRFWFQSKRWCPPSTWENHEARNAVLTALSLKSEFDKLAGASGSPPLICNLLLNASDANRISILQDMTESSDSELTELFQVAYVRIISSSGDTSAVELEQTDKVKCPRCRRYTSTETTILCNRCQQVIQTG